MQVSNKMKKIGKSFLFVIIFMILFIKIGELLQPNWNYGYLGGVVGYDDKMQAFYDFEADSVDVIFGDKYKYEHILS